MEYQVTYTGHDAAVALELQQIASAIYGLNQYQIPASDVEPETPREGMVRLADGTNWDPLSTGVAEVVVYKSGAWTGLGGAGGSITVGANVGTGAGVYKDVLAGALRLRSLVAGSNIVLTENADEVEVAFKSGQSVPEDPVIPATPTDLTVIPVWGALQLSVTTPGTDYAYTEFWRHTSDDRASATRIATSIVGVYTDYLVTSGTYYYWCRFVSQTGTVGDWNAVAGTAGTVGETPAFILDTLIGQISETHLIDSLNTRIDEIDTGASSILNRLTQTEADITQNANDVLSNASDILANAGEIITIKDTVFDVNTGVSANATAISALDGRVTTAEGSITANASAITSLQTDVSALQTDVSGNTSNITANANAVSLLDTRITTAEGDISVNSSDIIDLQAQVGALSAEGGPTWEFDVDQESWTATNAGITGPVSGVITFTPSAADPQLTSPTISTAGGIYTQVVMRVRQVTSGGTWQGRVYYQTSGHGFTASYYKDIADPSLVLNEWKTLTWDMSDLDAGGTDWEDSTIEAIRFDLVSDNAGAFEIDFIFIGKFSSAAISTALSALDARVTTNENGISTNASDITALDTRVTTAESDIVTNANATSTLDARVTVNEGDISSQASDITSLQSDLSNRRQVFSQATQPTATNIGDLWHNSSNGEWKRWNGTAWVITQDPDINANASAISVLQTDVSTAEGNITANAADITALDSRLTTAEGNIAGQATAISTLQTDVTNAEGNITANASDITTLQTNVGDNAAAIQTEASVRATETGELQALYAVRVNIGDPNNPYITGFGLASDLIDGNPTSDFIVQADRFSVVLPGDPANPEAVFVAGNINGSPGVGIRGDVIVDGTLNVNAIQAGSIGASKLSVSQLSAIAANLGTVTGGLFRTAASANRVEMEAGVQFPFWIGSNTKNAANGRFYYDANNDEVVIRGRLIAPQLDGGSNGFTVDISSYNGPLLSVNTMQTQSFNQRSAGYLFQGTFLGTGVSSTVLTFWHPGAGADANITLRKPNEPIQISAYAEAGGSAGQRVRFMVQVQYDAGAWQTVFTDYIHMTYNNQYSRMFYYTFEPVVGSWDRVNLRLRLENSVSTPRWFAMGMQARVTNIGQATPTNDNWIM